jgi:hypothetical protein
MSTPPIVSTFFPPEVAKQLDFYVYRLIDPRNGETFYVGKGKGNRVFAHAAGQQDELAKEQTSKNENESSILSDKMTRIYEIQNSGLTVQHVIHRHGLDSKTAFEVEAALIEAYPAVTNIAGGHGSVDRGVAHSSEIIRRYMAEDAVIDDPAVEIIVRRSATEKNLYDATRFAWRVGQARANKAKIALAVENGLIIGVFEIDEWLPANHKNFPGLTHPNVDSSRFGFVGREAAQHFQEKYRMKKVEPRARGAANPIRYHNV